MVPLVFGLIILVCVLLYHVIYNKEGFEDAGGDLEKYLRSVLPATVTTRMDTYELKMTTSKGSLKGSDVDELLQLMNDIEPYYKYDKISFKMFKASILLGTLMEVVMNSDLKVDNKDILDYLTKLKIEVAKARADIGLAETDGEKKLAELIQKATLAQPATATSTAQATPQTDETDVIIAEMSKSVPESVMRRMAQSNAANIMSFYEMPTKEGLFKMFDMIDALKPYYTAIMPYNKFKAARMKKGLEEIKSNASENKKAIIQSFINNIDALTTEHSLYNVGRLGVAPVIIDERAKTAIDSKLEVTGSTDDTYDKIKPMIMNEMKTMRKDIVNDVRQIVEKEGNSPAQEQGQEWAASATNKKPCPMCHDACDNDDYIRKDSIPCWNCNLPRST